jgi:hypothetical protein
MKYLTNRAAIFVMPKAPFVSWVQGLDAEAVKVSAEIIMTSHAAYLALDHEDGEDEEKLLKKNFQAVFEEQLRGWTLDETQWPLKRDLQTFQKWFHIAICTMVIDLADKVPILGLD